MREQTIRNTGRPRAEVQTGVLTEGVTQTPTMGFVQGIVKQPEKSKGELLANLFGVATQAAPKMYELYEGQKDEEATNQFAKDKFKYLETLNGLGSDAERQLWMHNKMQELSQPGVNEKYRNAFVNSFSGHYNSYVDGAKKESWKVQSNNLANDFVLDIAEGSFNWDKTTSKYHKVLPKDQYHAVFADAIIAQATLEATGIKTQEQLNEHVAKYKNILKQYKQHPYTGGSKSLDAIELQNKINKGLSSISSSLSTEFKNNVKLDLDKDRDSFIAGDTTKDVAIRNINKAVANKTLTPLEGKKKIDDINGEATRLFTAREQKDSFDITQDNNQLLKEKRLEPEAKEYITIRVQDTIKATLESNSPADFAFGMDTIKNHRDIGVPFIKASLKPTGDAQQDAKALALYTKLKQSKSSEFLLNQIDPKDKAILDVVTTAVKMNKNVPYSELYQTVMSAEKPDLSRSDREKFNGYFEGLPQGLQNEMYNYGTTLLKAGEDVNSIEPYINEVLTKHIQDYTSVFSTTDFKGIYLDKSSLATKGKDTIAGTFNSIGEKKGWGTDSIDNKTIVYDDRNKEYLVYAEDSKAFPIGILSADEVDKALDSFENVTYDTAASQAELEKVKKIRAKEALKQSLANPYSDEAIGGIIGDVINSIQEKWPDKSKQAGDDWDEFKQMLIDGFNGISDLVSPTEAQADTEIQGVSHEIQEMQEAARQEIGDVSFEDMRNAINGVPMESMLNQEGSTDTEGGSSYVYKTNEQKIEQVNHTPTSAVGRVQDSLISSEGTTTHLDTRNILTLPGGIVPDRNSIKVKNPNTNQFEAIDPRNVPNWLTGDSLDTQFEMDFTNVSKTIDGVTYKYSDDPENFNNKVLTAFEQSIQTKVTGYNNYSDEVKAALLTNAWNAGANSVTYSGFRNALNYIDTNTINPNSLTNNDKKALLEPAFKHIVSGNKVLASLIHRRAELFNAVSNETIDGIKVTGTKGNYNIIFYNGNNVVYNHNYKANYKYGNKLNIKYTYTPIQ